MHAVQRTLLTIADRNPMRRRIDRIEAWTRLALLAVVVMLTPLLGWQAGRVVYRNGLRAERVEGAERVRTAAVLLEDAPGTATNRSTPSPAAVPARWIGADGLPHTARILVTDRSPAGTTVMVWIDATGQLTEAPRGHDQTVGQAVAAALLTATGVTVLLALVALVVTKVFDRRRLDRWQTEWFRIEPQWSGRS